MFELDIEMLKEQGLQLVDSDKKTAQDLADKGKNKLDLLNQQARLSKAQRQLGALVSACTRPVRRTRPGREVYQRRGEVEKAIEEIKANMTDDERAEVEAQETAENTEPRGSPRRGRGNRGRTPSSCAVRQRSARPARPKWPATRCSATTAALSCKIRQNETLQEKRCQHLTNPAICVK